jgi:hypothetical protein
MNSSSKVGEHVTIDFLMKIKKPIDVDGREISATGRRPISRSELWLVGWQPYHMKTLSDTVRRPGLEQE